MLGCAFGARSRVRASGRSGICEGLPRWAKPPSGARGSVIAASPRPAAEEGRRGAVALGRSRPLKRREIRIARPLPRASVNPPPGARRVHRRGPCSGGGRSPCATSERPAEQRARPPGAGGLAGHRRRSRPDHPLPSGFAPPFPAPAGFPKRRRTIRPALCGRASSSPIRSTAPGPFRRRPPLVGRGRARPRRRPIAGGCLRPPSQTYAARSAAGAALQRGADFRLVARRASMGRWSVGRRDGRRGFRTSAGSISCVPRVPSLALSPGSRVAAGSLDIGIGSPGSHDWDIAAGESCSRGGRRGSPRSTGRRPRFNNETATRRGAGWPRAPALRWRSLPPLVGASAQGARRPQAAPGLLPRGGCVLRLDEAKRLVVKALS